jgi:uncharacterized membrane protein
MELTLRPMSTSQVLDRTFYLYRNNFVLFSGIAIIAPALKLIALLIQLKMFGPMVIPQQPQDFTPEIFQALLVRAIITAVVGTFTYIVGTALASSATAYAVSLVHLGRTTTIAESYRKIKPILSRILGLLCMVLLLAVGPLLLIYGLFLGISLFVLFMAKSGKIVPGFAFLMMGGSLLLFVLLLGAFVWMVIAFCRYALAVAACTLENLPVRQSITRSSFLTHGAKWGVFGIVLLTGLMTFILTYVLQLPALLANNAVMITGKTHLSIAATIWIYVADFLGSTLAGPITTVALVLVYYDQRIKKEAFDLQLLMQAIGQPATVPQATAAPTIG